MIEYIVYGKIIIDTIKCMDGRIAEDVLGGGGPQAAFGARLWDSSIGLLTRSGTDILPGVEKMLRGIDVDLSGWVQYDDLPTTHIRKPFSEALTESEMETLRIEVTEIMERMQVMLKRPLPLPGSYHKPKVIHLISEYANEPMVKTALELREKGTVFSLEPLIMPMYHNYEDILSILPQVDIVTPDFPAASGVANSEDPGVVLEYWSKLGPTLVAIRHGEHGSYTWDRENGQFWHIPPVPVEVVDVTGAGNCYGGGLMVGWEKTRDAKNAGCYGSVSASFLVRQYGIPEMSEALQVEARQLLDQAMSSAQSL
jgi:sugar/nucleoside kinase (ribokinase family)